jgi:hypothetical protein
MHMTGMGQYFLERDKRFDIQEATKQFSYISKVSSILPRLAHLCLVRKSDMDIFSDCPIKFKI